MKRIKKLASLMLAMIMVLSMAMTVFAAEPTETKKDSATCSITVNKDNKNYVYNAYQIFKGDLYGEKLSNIEWSDDVDSSATIANLKDMPEFTALAGKEDVTVQDILDILNDKADDSATAQAFANAIVVVKDNAHKLTYDATKKAHVVTGLTPGYYVIEDDTVDTNLEGFEVKDEDGNTIKVVATRSRNVLEVVGPDAEVTPKDVSSPKPDKTTTENNDSTSAEGQDGQTSASHDVGDSVPFQLKATMPDPIVTVKTYRLVFKDTYQGLKYNEDAVVKVNGTVITEGFAIDDTVPGSLTITFDDVKAAPINAIAGTVITIDYTMTITAAAETGEKDPITNKLKLEFDHNGEKTETPEVETPVYDFDVEVNKTDGSAPLKGAAFKLDKWVVAEDGTGSWKEVKSYEAGETTTFTFAGLDEGYYKLTETDTPAGYNSIEPVAFKIAGQYEKETDVFDRKIDRLIGLTGTQIELDDDENILFVDGKVVEVTGDGKVLNFAEKGDAHLVLTTDVVNKSGSLLPSTGGIGTTIFYVIGGILVLGAGILLVTKRRMRSN